MWRRSSVALLPGFSDRFYCGGKNNCIRELFKIHPLLSAECALQCLCSNAAGKEDSTERKGVYPVIFTFRTAPLTSPHMHSKQMRFLQLNYACSATKSDESMAYQSRRHHLENSATGCSLTTVSFSFVPVSPLFRSIFDQGEIACAVH
jgi:hypothetical protein